MLKYFHDFIFQEYKNIIILPPNTTKHVNTLSQPYFSIQSEKSAEKKECSICILEYLYQNELVSVLLCKHMFHTSCIEKWLENENNNNCPLCRKIVKYIT
jgi:hypothetical protein